MDAIEPLDAMGKNLSCIRVRSTSGEVHLSVCVKEPKYDVVKVGEWNELEGSLFMMVSGHFVRWNSAVYSLTT